MAGKQGSSFRAVHVRGSFAFPLAAIQGFRSVRSGG